MDSTVASQGGGDAVHEDTHQVKQSEAEGTPLITHYRVGTHDWVGTHDRVGTHYRVGTASGVVHMLASGTVTPAA